MASFFVVAVFLFNDYDDIQSKFKQYIDYNQLFQLVVDSKMSNPPYWIERVRNLAFDAWRW